MIWLACESVRLLAGRGRPTSPKPSSAWGKTRVEFLQFRRQRRGARLDASALGRVVGQQHVVEPVGHTRRDVAAGVLQRRRLGFAVAAVFGTEVVLVQRQRRPPAGRRHDFIGGVELFGDREPGPRSSCR